MGVRSCKMFVIVAEHCQKDLGQGRSLSPPYATIADWNIAFPLLVSLEREPEPMLEQNCDTLNSEASRHYHAE